jgi:hypothetical protein
MMGMRRMPQHPNPMVRLIRAVQWELCGFVFGCFWS